MAKCVVDQEKVAYWPVHFWDYLVFVALFEVDLFLDPSTKGQRVPVMDIFTLVLDPEERPINEHERVYNLPHTTCTGETNAIDHGAHMLM